MTKVAKARTMYTCQGCGSTSPKWLGRCPDCGEWNSFVEETVTAGPARPSHSSPAGARPGKPRPITELDTTGESRVSTRIGELDRVLGGGMVPGSAILIGGDPGIGKSTLLLQAMGGLAAGGAEVLYVTGEESARQIRLRAERTGALSPELVVYVETCVEKVCDAIRETGPQAVVVDSVQTMYTDTLDSAPGSVAQLRETSARLIHTAKSMDVPLFLVGHVTKEGAIAGPRVLEHMVDTVLYFEGERGHEFRILRAVKNRFGSVMEIGVFEMKDSGLSEVTNPSEVFLAERPEHATGSAVVASLEGTRTILVEVQSLVCPTLFGVPRRTVVGVDYNKVMLLAAVLEKKAGMSLANHDIFIKVAGGMRLDEPAVDLGVMAAITSNFKDEPVREGTVIVGEVGLAGEVRPVTQAASRVREAEKLGFTRCVLPAESVKGLKGKTGIETAGVRTVTEAIEAFF